MTVYTDLKKFVDDMEAAARFKDWCNSSSVDCAAWKTYRSGLLTQMPSPPPPTMTTSFGRALVDVGIMAVDAGLAVPPPTPPPPPLTAAFFFVISGTTVTFTDASKTGPSGAITAWRWTFGDGSTSTAQNPPPHVYAANGTYSVTLTVTSPDGSSTVTHSVATTGVAPVASFTAAASGLTVAFTDASIPGSSGTITNWAWDFGDGGTSTAQNPSHTYAADGTYTITLTVTGGGSDGTDPFSLTLTVAAVTPPPPPPSGGTPGIGIFQAGGSLANVSAANLPLYHIVIGDAFDNLVKVQTCPGKGLVYFNATVVKQSFSTGVTYADALANGWLLKDSGGNYMVNSFGAYLADVGSASYRSKWISNVLAYLAAHPGIDGVFIDEVVSDPAGSSGGKYPVKYPTTAAWSTVMAGCVSAIYAALSAKSFYVVLNGGTFKSGDATYADGTSTLNWWAQIGPHCDALMNENYAEASVQGVPRVRVNGTAWYQQWTGWQRLIPQIQAMGKSFVGLMYGTTSAQRIYGKASFLLEWNGGNGVFAFHSGPGDPTNADWTKNMGAPSGAKVAVGVGWRRDFANGVVLVNPSASASQVFIVSGTPHTVAPGTALIL